MVKDILNSRVCQKKSIKYLKDNKYILDCVDPTKIYRFIYSINRLDIKKRIVDIESEIKKEKNEFIKIVDKISEYVNKKEKQKELNELRDKLIEKDEILFILSNNLDNIKKSKDRVLINKNKAVEKVIINRKIKESKEKVEDIKTPSATKKKKKISDILETLEIEKKEDQDEQYDLENKEKDEEYEDIMYNKTIELTESENAEIVERY